MAGANASAVGANLRAASERERRLALSAALARQQLASGASGRAEKTEEEVKRCAVKDGLRMLMLSVRTRGDHVIAL